MGKFLHPASCDCPAHAKEVPPGASWWSTLLPALACAVCPACLSTYAKLLSVAGVGFGLSELEHQLLMLGAISASLAISVWRSYRARRVWPFAVALLGATLVLSGHLLGEWAWLEVSGVLLMLSGALVEHFRLRGAPRRSGLSPSGTSLVLRPHDPPGT
jgi:hypothetical protein